MMTPAKFRPIIFRPIEGLGRPPCPCRIMPATCSQLVKNLLRYFYIAVKIPAVTARSRQVNRPVVPVDRVDADHALAAVEQGGEHPARPHIAEFVYRIPARHRGVAHGIEALGEL